MRILRSFSGITAVPIFLLVASACVGREVSLGSNSSSMALVDPSTVSAAPTTCAAGMAHSNVCCDSQPGSPAKCGVYPGEPFHPCDGGYKTYPNPNECCALDDPSKCSAPSETPPDPKGSCYYGCAPGWYPIPNGCCQDSPDGKGGTCYGWASAGDAGVADASADVDSPDAIVIDVDGGSAPDSAVVFDSGKVEDSGWYPPTPCAPGYQDVDGSCIAPPSPSPPPCDLSCPPGWQAAKGAPDVCCRETGGGSFECFSQGTGPIPPQPDPDGGPIAVDGGAPTVDAGENCFWDGGVCLPCRAAEAGAPGDCSVATMFNGHCYAIDCGSGWGCACLVDQVETATDPKAPTNVCSGDLFAQESKACKFPF